jgi:glycosyltransferase involved in cell wall biosynthesis
MKIAFVTTFNALDIKSWSGTSYYMAKALSEEGLEIEYIGELNSFKKISNVVRLKDFIYNRLFQGKLGKYLYFYESSNLKYISTQVQNRLAFSDADIVFSPGAIPIAYLKTSKPIVMWSDATFAVLNNYYSQFSDFSFYTTRDCHKYEKNVFKKLSLALFSSEWAARSAIEYYGAKADIVKVIPYGANILCDRGIEDIEEINKLKSRKICKLLFIGQDWERKGGMTAVNIAIELNKLNVKTELTIIGCRPPDTLVLPEFVNVIGFVDKSKKEGNILIDRFYRESHFFILPTIAECTPIVFSEANSYGLPVITINTGGVSSIIHDDINGKMFNIKLNAIECADYISRINEDINWYNKFSLTSFNEYLNRLNWKVSIKKVVALMEELTKNNI